MANARSGLGTVRMRTSSIRARKLSEITGPGRRSGANLFMSVRAFLKHPLAKCLCSLTILALVGSLVDWGILSDSLRGYDPANLVVAGLAALAILFFLGLRWAVMALEVEPGRGIRHFRNFLFGICIGSVTPANIGADVYRFAALLVDGQKWQIVGLLIQEKILLLVGYLIASSIALVWIGLDGGASTGGYRLAALSAALLSGTGVAALIGFASVLRAIAGHRFLSGRNANWMERLGRLVDLGKPRRFLPLLVLTALSIAAWLVTVTAVARGLNVTLSMPLLWLAAIAADMARWAPFSLQGIGLREGAFASMFLAFGGDPSLGFAVGGIAYLLLTCAMIASGVFALAIDATGALQRGATTSPTPAAPPPSP